MFSFALSAIRIVGIALITTYVGIGMVMGPINHIRGYPDPRTELIGVRNRRTGIQIEISAILQNRLVKKNFVIKLFHGVQLKIIYFYNNSFRISNLDCF